MFIFRILLLICSYFCWSVNANPVEWSNEVSNLISTITHRRDKFPEDFEFGAATAAFQIEGAWDTDNRGPSIWDTFTHEHPELIADGSNADVGPDSYHYFEDDIKALKSVGMDYYRLSISWSRILPDGDIANVNELGIKYYNKLLDHIIDSGIKPMVTMYHYDLPDALQKKFGGLTNEIFVDYFEAYANLLFERFGDRVKTWITFNEPYEFCTDGYGDGTKAPLVNANGVGEYLCGNNVLKAHAAAYHLYKGRYQSKQKGKLGLTLSSMFYYSPTNDTEVVDRAMQFRLGWFTHPIFSSEGGYPNIMVSQIKGNSLREGRGWSRLPELSPQWRKMIKGSADFLGLNYYTSRLVEARDKAEGANPSWERDTMLKFSISPDWKPSHSAWLYSVPQGVGDILRWIKNEYDNPDVIITENGWSDDGRINDEGRIEYLKEHLTHMLDAVVNSGCNLKAYTVWSIIDNFEWARGYSERFGLYSVNFTSPRKERTPKESARFMRNVIQTHTIPSTRDY